MEVVEMVDVHDLGVLVIRVMHLHQLNAIIDIDRFLFEFLSLRAKGVIWGVRVRAVRALCLPGLVTGDH